MYFNFFMFLQILGDSVEDPERQLCDGGGGLGPVRDEDESARPGHALPPPLPPPRPGGRGGEAARRGQARQSHLGQPAVCGGSQAGERETGEAEG